MLTCVRHFNVPKQEVKQRGLLIAANHQSFLDPVLIGGPLVRPVHFLARTSLFEVPGFRTLLPALNAHPVHRGRVDPEALRTTLRLLRNGETLLIFPEGTRTRDGRLGHFKPGAGSIAIRCGVPVLPVCIEGAFECWPRSQKLPRPRRVAVMFGKPIPTNGRDPKGLTAEVARDVANMQKFLRNYLNKVAFAE